MENEELYFKYISYLDWKLSKLRLTKGSYSLLRMSKSNFEAFINKYENDRIFEKRILGIYTSESRDKKIDYILDDDLEDQMKKVQNLFDDFDF